MVLGRLLLAKILGIRPKVELSIAVVGPTNRETMQMEILFKIAITAVLLCFMYYQLVFLRGVWRSQIDPGATVGRILETLKPKTDVIATRDQNKIYQGGKPVGDVSGDVAEDAATVKFTRLLNTSALSADQPFEYRRLRLKIRSIAARSGNYVNQTDAGTITGTDVLSEVVCDKLPQ